jgi:hypothetical protein
MGIVRSVFNILHFHKRNWKAIALCIFAATVFWFLNALNKTYTTNVRFPLSFEYDRDNFVPVHALPKNIYLNVTGNGWNLFRRSTGVKIPPLEIPLDRPGETRKLERNTLLAYFTNQLSGLTINHVLTDTLYVDLEPKAGRRVAVTLDTLGLQLKNGYGIASHISIMPDSILVEGPRTLIRNLAEPLVIALPLKNIDEDFREDVEVKLAAADVVKRDPPTVAVMFKVEKLETVRDSATLVIRNLPGDVWPLLGRKKIPFTATIPRNMLDQYERDSVKAILNLKKLTRGERTVYPVLTGLPPFTTIIRVDSVRIKF